MMRRSTVRDRLVFATLLALLAMPSLALFVWALSMSVNDFALEVLAYSVTSALCWSLLPVFVAVLVFFERGRRYALATARQKRAIAVNTLRWLCGSPLIAFALFTVLAWLPLGPLYYVFGREDLPIMMLALVSIETAAIFAAFFVGSLLPRARKRTPGTN